MAQAVYKEHKFLLKEYPNWLTKAESSWRVEIAPMEFEIDPEWIMVIQRANLDALYEQIRRRFNMIFQEEVERLQNGSEE